MKGSLDVLQYLYHQYDIVSDRIEDAKEYRDYVMSEESENTPAYEDKYHKAGKSVIDLLEERSGIWRKVKPIANTEYGPLIDKKEGVKIFDKLERRLDLGKRKKEYG